MHTFTITVSKHKKSVTVDNDKWNYTDFQIGFMLKVQQRSGFEYFAMHDHKSGMQRQKGSVVVIWLENGDIHHTGLGVNNFDYDEECIPKERVKLYERKARKSK